MSAYPEQRNFAFRGAMSRGRRAQRAAREDKKAREKRARRVQRDTRRSQVRMTVVNASQDSQNAMSLVHEMQQCNSALLYADEVTLVSPRAALLKNAQQISESDGIELLRVFKDVAPKFFPDVSEELRSTFEKIDSLPPRLQLPRHLRDESTPLCAFLLRAYVPFERRCGKMSKKCLPSRDMINSKTL
jgi:hypothetical protein